MSFEVDKRWIKFMESPIAVLEDYGLPIRTINSLEVEYGIYIKHIQYVTETSLAACASVGPETRKRLKRSLVLFYQDVMEGKG